MSVPKSNVPSRKTNSYLQTTPPRPEPEACETGVKPQSADWLHELARQERDRAAEVNKFNTAAASFLQALYHQIVTDVDNFRAEFPDRAIRTRFDAAQNAIEVINMDAGPPTPQVLVSTNSANQTLMLVFEFRPNLNREVPATIVNDELTIELAGRGPFTTLSRVVLTPVLFPELTGSTLLYLSETSGLT